MIKKSIFTTNLLLLLHLLFILHNPSLGEVTHQWQENINKAQEYIYSNNVDTVIVGSSLSARIIGDSIPSVKSLSFSGCSVEDGLIIIQSKEQVPKCILVESNFFFRDNHSELFSGIIKGPMSIFRKWIPSLREQYEPICLYNSLFNCAYNDYIKMKKGQLGVETQDKRNLSQKSSIDIKILNEGILRYKEADNELSDQELRKRLNKMKGHVNELEARGCLFIFFEMPINDKLIHLKQNNQTRNILHKEFPQNKYLYLPSDTSDYITTDGIHLDLEEQIRFSHYFRTILDKYRK